MMVEDVVEIYDQELIIKKSHKMRLPKEDEIISFKNVRVISSEHFFMALSRAWDLPFFHL